MRCEVCPDQLVCWAGLLERHPCGICNRVEIHTIGERSTTILPTSRILSIVLRSCPRNNPAPVKYFDNVICHVCRVRGNYDRPYAHFPYSPEWSLMIGDAKNIPYVVEND